MTELQIKRELDEIISKAGVGIPLRHGGIESALGSISVVLSYMKFEINALEIEKAYLQSVLNGKR